MWVQMWGGRRRKARRISGSGYSEKEVGRGEKKGGKKPKEERVCVCVPHCVGGKWLKDSNRRPGVGASGVPRVQGSPGPPMPGYSQVLHVGLCTKPGQVATGGD